MESPTFSIVIPTYARPQSLATALDRISKLDWPVDDYEVIVVDDGSPAGNESVIWRLADRLDVRLLKQVRKGPAAARNAGARHARGEFLAFLDDDCLADPGWLKALSRAFADHPQALLGGETSNALADNPFSEAAQHISGYLNHHLTAESGVPKFFTSNNIALSAAVFARVGGFNTQFQRPAGEDREFCRRLSECGYQLRVVEDAMVLHAHELTLGGFWRQNFNYGRGAALFHRLRGASQRVSWVPEPLSFYSKLIVSPLGAKSGFGAWLQVALLCLSQVAVTSGFAWEKAAARNSQKL